MALSSPDLIGSLTDGKPASDAAHLGLTATGDSENLII